MPLTTTLSQQSLLLKGVGGLLHVWVTCPWSTPQPPHTHALTQERQAPCSQAAGTGELRFQAQAPAPPTRPHVICPHLRQLPLGGCVRVPSALPALPASDLT